MAIGVLAFLAAGLFQPSSAGAACASSVYVGGYVQIGQLVRGGELPPADGTVAAVFPGCNDGGGTEPDRRGTVTRLKGVPPTVATRDEDTVYIARGQMTALAGHPVHAETPKRRNCSPGPAVRRRAVASSATATPDRAVYPGDQGVTGSRRCWASWGCGRSL